MKTEDVKKLSPEERLTYWITERESIRRKKTLGLPTPWTDDEILQTYRFCNVRRMDDKVSDWLLRNWYRPYKDHDNIVLAAVLARQLNKPESLEAVGFPRVWEPERVQKVLEDRAAKGLTNFNPAYMITGSYGKRDRPPESKPYQLVHRVLQPLQDSTTEIDSSSMESTCLALSTQPGLSMFLAGQVTADLRWAMSGAWSDRNTWAAIGPGSRRGMNRLKERPVEAPLEQEQFTEELQGMMKWLGFRLSKDLTKRLEAIDYQNCLCEYDKYTRALLGEGRPKQLYKVVQ